jgi:hypothetical protein
MPTADRIKSAVFGTGMCWDSIKNVEVAETKKSKKTR